ITTDSNGDGSLVMASAFPVGKVGAGSVVLTRNSLDQYYSGSSVSSGGVGGGPNFEADLVQCNNVNIFLPNTLSVCSVAQDSLKTGSVIVDANSGNLTITLQGALPKASYGASTIFAGGVSRLLGTGLISTDSKG